MSTRSRRVLASVGERLLQDPIRGEIDTGREGARLSLDLDVHRKAVCPCLFDELLAVGQTRERGGRRWLVSFAEQAEHLTHLSESLSRGVLDGREGCLHAPGLASERMPAGASLHRDHADPVRDDVMQLAGNPSSLGGDGEARLLVALTLELRGQIGKLRSARDWFAPRPRLPTPIPQRWPRRGRSPRHL